KPLNRYIAGVALADFQGTRFSKYQPGWPLLLAVGARAGVEWLVAPLLGATLVFLVLSFVAKRYGPDLVTPALLCFALGACLWFNFASFRAHTATMLCVFGAFLLFDSEEADGGGSALRVFAVGALLGLAALIRYIDWIPLGGWIVWRLLRQR